MGSDFTFFLGGFATFTSGAFADTTTEVRFRDDIGNISVVGDFQPVINKSVCVLVSLPTSITDSISIYRYLYFHKPKPLVSKANKELHDVQDDVNFT